MVFNATFNNFSYIVSVGFIGGGTSEYPVKTTNLSQVIDKLYHIMLNPKWVPLLNILLKNFTVLVRLPLNKKPL
jgi:hypothetical protein